MLNLNAGAKVSGAVTHTITDKWNIEPCTSKIEKTRTWPAKKVVIICDGQGNISTRELGGKSEKFHELLRQLDALTISFKTGSIDQEEYENIRKPIVEKLRTLN
jgi:hypothetical protein